MQKKALTTLQSGFSYWQARLSSGRVLCQLDTIVDIRQAHERDTEWLEDVIGSDDLSSVVEIALCTPHGDAHLECERPYGFFQLNTGMVSLLNNEKFKTAQIVGCLEGNRGDCICAIWDTLEQRLYPEFHTNVLDFAAWRAGVQAPGRLNIEDLRLIL